MKQILLIIFLGASVSATAQILSLSFDDALRQMQQGNRSLKIADKDIEAARMERDKLNALLVSEPARCGHIRTPVRKDRSEATVVAIYRPCQRLCSQPRTGRPIYQQYPRPDRQPHPHLSARTP